MKGNFIWFVFLINLLILEVGNIRLKKASDKLRDKLPLVLSGFRIFKQQYGADKILFTIL